MNIAVVTTFPNNCFEVYAKQMLTSFCQYWPQEIPLLVELDDNLLVPDVQKCLRNNDAIAVGWEPDHKAFVERNKDKDDPNNYRKQAVRFCHKVFTLKRALDAAIAQKKEDPSTAPRYLIWLDADVITNRPVSLDDIKLCLPKEGDAVAYLGRKDWDHSECGWLAFDLENDGLEIIESLVDYYREDEIFKLDQWHDSFAFDKTLSNCSREMILGTNLTENKPGMDIWPHSPMGKWSTHFKGPVAKQKLIPQQQQVQPRPGSNIVIQTRNAIPHEEIRKNIETNQELITNWIRGCKPTNEEIVVVSAGPMLIAEDVREEVKAGRRIVAVKHALEPLKKAGITPWACILLDPRDHVANFVDNADKNILWFVASQCDPEVTRKLLKAGCTVWGYHAAVGADEQELTKKQGHAIIVGGSATATRGLYTLNHLGFSKFRLYGYDLCYPEKPDLNAKDPLNQPKYLEMSIGFSHHLYSQKRVFWTEPQLIAQFEELNEIIKADKFKIKAYGNGVIPFIIKAKETGELRERELKAKINGTPPTYEKLLKCRKPLINWPLKSLPILRKMTKSSSY